MDENTEEFAYPRNYGALRNQITDIAQSIHRISGPYVTAKAVNDQGQIKKKDPPNDRLCSEWPRPHW